LPKRVEWPLVGVLLAAAAALRFTALDVGLRHAPHMDERYFVESARLMLREGDVDHRFYEYPGLVFYLLAPVLALHDPRADPHAAYLAARRLVAGFGVASAGLAYLLGRRLGGWPAGALAGALSAVSPVGVQTAHAFRPDVVLETFSLLALLAADRAFRRGRGYALAGVALGAAGAVKFSAILLVPAVVLGWALARPRRLRDLLTAGVVAVATFAACSPYTFLNLPAAREGARVQAEHAYLVRPGGPASYPTTLGFEVRRLAKAVGWPALVLAVAGLVAGRRDFRRLAPLALVPIVAVGVFATAEVGYDRLLLFSVGVVAALAGRGLVSGLGLGRTVAVVLAAVVVVPPLLGSREYLSAIARPSTRDLALDWIEATLAAGRLVVTGLPDLGLDRGRFDVLSVADGSGEMSRLLPEADLVVTLRADLPEAQVLFVARPASTYAGPPVHLVRALRPARYRALVLRPEWVVASEEQHLAPALVDGDPATAWQTRGPQSPGAFLEVRLPAPVRLGRIELLLGGRGRLYAGSIEVLVRDDAGAWRPAPAFPLRPPVRNQASGRGPHSQVYALAPAAVKAVRLVQGGERVRPWAVTEILLSERLEP
jgi:hypothetical protein